MIIHDRASCHNGGSIRSLWQTILGVFLLSQISFLLFFRDVVVVWEADRWLGDDNDGSVDVTMDGRIQSWLFDGGRSDISSPAVSNATCSDDSSNLSSFLPPQTDGRIRQLVQNCTDLAVYGATFDEITLQDFHNAMMLRQNYSQHMLQKHKSCFFLFVMNVEHDQDHQNDENVPTITQVGHWWVIPLQIHSLPYQNPSQNVDFIKYAAPKLIFGEVESLIWQDPAVFFAPSKVWKQPWNYKRLANSGNACLSAIAAADMPSTKHSDESKMTTSMERNTAYHPTNDNPPAKDTAMHQTQQQHVAESKDQAFASTSFMIWRNHGTNAQHTDEKFSSCNRFNRRLQCNMLDALHQQRLHNDQNNDELLFPAVVASLAPKSYHKDAEYTGQIHELDLFDDQNDASTDNISPRITIIRNNCHIDRSEKPLGENCNYWQRNGDDFSLLLPFGARDSIHAHQTIDDNTCTSPEQHVPFPLQGDIQIHTISNATTHHRSCGLKANNPISKYLREELRNKLLPKVMGDCHDLVVYGVALGTNFVENIYNATAMDPGRSTHLLHQHGKCFVMFVSQRDVAKATLHGHVLLIPIPQWVFPYQNNRRNTKLLKYAGSLVFPNTTTLIWEDAKFFSEGLRYKQPTDYHAMTRKSEQNDDETNKIAPCLTAFGLPVHPNTLGMHHPSVVSGSPHVEFTGHCDQIVRAIRHRPNVTDSVDSVSKQCIKYVQRIQDKYSSTKRLDHAMVDTAFMIWHQHTSKCRAFNNALRCTLLSEIHCHSDRDQVPWPFVMNEMELAGYYEGSDDIMVRADDKDDDWNPRIQDLEMRHGDEEAANATTMVTILRSNCHWYKSPIGRGCKYWDH